MHEEENRAVTILLLGVVRTPHHRTGKGEQTFDCDSLHPTLNTLPVILVCVQPPISAHNVSVVLPAGW